MRLIYVIVCGIMWYYVQLLCGIKYMISSDIQSHLISNGLVADSKPTAHHSVLQESVPAFTMDAPKYDQYFSKTLKGNAEYSSEWIKHCMIQPSQTKQNNFEWSRPWHSTSVLSFVWHIFWHSFWRSGRAHWDQALAGRRRGGGGEGKELL